MEIGYSDGTSVEAGILDIVQKSTAIDSFSAPGVGRYSEWPVRYHLCPERANLLRHLDFEGLDVVELGAGMGAVSRLLAERSKSLTVVEGTQSRFSVLSSRLRDLKNWSGHVGNLDAVAPDPKDVVCVVGVLEYSELYLKPPADFHGGPFDWFLQLTKRWMREDGVLILAIENALGMKYWAGAPEDHTDRLFDGICGYSNQPTPRTFSLKELLALLERAGFAAIEQYFPFPDYKVPTTVLSREFIERAPELVSSLATTKSFESYGVRRAKLFPEVLAMESAARAGLAADLSNSLLLVASLKKESNTLHRLTGRSHSDRALAWHYANYRKQPTRTTFRQKQETIVVEKDLISRPDLEQEAFRGETLSAVWKQPAIEKVSTGSYLRTDLVRTAYYEGPEAAVKQLTEFLRWSLGHWGSPMRPEAVDAILTNTIVQPSGAFETFDLEWTLEGPMLETWFVLRNTLALAGDFEAFAKNASFENLSQLYAVLCGELGLTPDLENDIQREGEFQSLVTIHSSIADRVQSIRALLERKAKVSVYPKHVHRYEEVIPRILAKLPKGAYRSVGKKLFQASRIPHSLFKRVFE